MNFLYVKTKLYIILQVKVNFATVFNWQLLLNQASMMIFPFVSNKRFILRDALFENFIAVIYIPEVFN